MALNALCDFMNNPLLTGLEKPEPATAIAGLPPAAEGDAARFSRLAAEPPPPSPPPQVNAQAAPRANFDKLFYTGRLCVGKDYLAAQTGATIEGFARPLYALASHFFGLPVDANTNKELPGLREFLQTAGQWGRATVSKEYPLTVERASFITMVRELGRSGHFNELLGVEWLEYGRKENIWLDAALMRVVRSGATRNAITNVRFNNEFERLSKSGWLNWHVMTTPAEWHARLENRGIKPDAPVLRDVSEQLAAHLDNQVTKEISQRKSGGKLRVIWNSNTPPPSSRLWTVTEFLRAANVRPVTVQDSE